MVRQYGIKFLCQVSVSWEQPERAGRHVEQSYSFQGVVDMLEKLHDKFEDERTDLEKEESNARHAYEMLIQVFAGMLCFTI